MNKVAIIGAGFAGLTAARLIGSTGATVTVFDKGRKPGGRLATRRGEFSFNHGCQYASARDPGFLALLQEYGAQPWPDARKFAGVPDMASLAERAARALDIRLETQVVALERNDIEWQLVMANGPPVPADTLILAIPAPQAAVLLASTAHPFGDALAAVHLSPCWCVMLAFDGLVPGIDTLRLTEGPLSWISRETSRPGEASGPVRYTLHAAPDWSTQHLMDDKEVVISALSAAFAAATGITTPAVHQAAHRWKYALADRPLGQPCLWDKGARLGLCGDWCLDGKLEAAYLSGQAMAEQYSS